MPHRGRVCAPTALLGAALVACTATEGADTWVRPGSDPVTAQQDKRDCENIARAALARRGPMPNEELGTSGSSLPRTLPRPESVVVGGDAGQVVDQCLRERGYTRQRG